MSTLPYDVLWLIAQHLPEQAIWRWSSTHRRMRVWLTTSYLPRRIHASGRTDENYPGGILAFYRRYFVCSGCGTFERTQDPRDHGWDGRWECTKCEKRRSTAQLDMMDRIGWDHRSSFYQESYHDASF